MSVQGSGVALVTPFGLSGEVDEVGLKKLIRFHIENGTDYLVILGTTGEAATLSPAERFRILDLAKEEGAGKIGLVAGFGGNDTNKVCHEITDYDCEGYDAILSVSPYYNRPSQEGIYAHYAQIADRTGQNIILYNVPSRTGSNLQAATTLRLAHAFDNIIAVKEASGNLSQCMDILAGRPNNFQILSGDDLLCYPLMTLGCDGLISVLANAFPAHVSGMVHALLDGNFTLAQQTHFDLLPLIHLIFEEGNPTGVKSAMKLLGLCSEYCRMPLIPGSEQLEEKMASAIKNLRMPSLP